MQVNPRNGDLAIAVLLLAVGAFFLWGGWRMPAGTFSVPGPGIVPTILSVLLAATALAIVVKTLIAGSPGAGVPVSFGIAPVATVFALLAAVAFAFERTGFMATTSVFLFAMLRVFSRLGALRSALVGAGIALAAHWFFGSLLGVNLPRGPW